MDVAWPLFAGLRFILKVIHKVLFVWWLDPWLQRRASRELLDDIHANLHFLVSAGQTVSSRRTAVLPFDYASVQIIYENILFCFTRGQGQLNVSVSPRHLPAESYEFGRVVAALDSRRLAAGDLVNHLGGVASLLRSHLIALNDAFSEREYPGLRGRL
jgi:hypothetical protein